MACFRFSPGQWGKFAVAVVAALTIWAGANIAAAQNPLLENISSQLDLDFFDRFWQELERDVQEYLPDLSWQSLQRWLQGEEVDLDPGSIMRGLGRYFMGEVFLNLKLMGQLLLLAVVAAFLHNLQAAFGREQVAVLTRSVVLIVLVGIGLRSFGAALGTASKAVDNMVDFILAMLPTLLALLASLGNLASPAILHPVVIFGVNFFGSFIRNAIFPLIFLSVVLALADQFSAHFKVGRLADLFRDLSIWGMGLSMTFFVSILVVQGVTGTVSDAVTLRTAKYMTGTFVPVVGKMLADAVETVAGASLILKNGIYITGTVVLLLMTAFPLLKLAALIIMYKLAAALVQPLGETGLGDSLNIMGNCLSLAFAAVAGVALVFIMAVTMVVGAGNITTMFR